MKLSIVPSVYSSFFIIIFYLDIIKVQLLEQHYGSVYSFKYNSSVVPLWLKICKSKIQVICPILHPIYGGGRGTG